MSLMTRLAVAVQSKNPDLSADLDLPIHLINIYACSVYRFDGGHPVHCNIAAAHTAVAVAKLGNWCVEQHGFRPYRSTCKTPVRRLRMNDLIENPGAYDAALQLAKANGESDVVAALRRLPAWISAQTGVAIPELGADAASSLWSALSAEIGALPVREVR
jgi:hypothetical protein